MVSGIIPGLLSFPLIVKVFPEHVCPYANIHANLKKKYN
jgi:hypothetical protein